MLLYRQVVDACEEAGHEAALVELVGSGHPEPLPYGHQRPRARLRQGRNVGDQQVCCAKQRFAGRRPSMTVSSQQVMLISIGPSEMLAFTNQ
jgi:hypothetical protein